jgi:thiosulfate/3-mercaptopyruvate sulfurtransferase
MNLSVEKLRARHGDRTLFLASDAEIAAQLGNLGLTRTTPVVICFDDKFRDATLAAVAMTRVGHRALAILEGGVLHWAAERRPLVTTIDEPAPAVYEPQAGADDFSIDIDQLASQVDAGTTALLDARPPDFFRGEKSTEARPGHIPGAVNRLYSLDLTRTDGGEWLLPRAALQQDYEALGLDQHRPVTVYCRTGHQASQSYFVLRYLLGYDDVRWFNGSWTEWAERTDLPAVTGGR